MRPIHTPPLLPPPSSLPPPPSSLLPLPARRLAKTQQNILIVVRKSVLLEGNTPSQMSTPNLDEKIRLRSPYVAPLNVLQVGRSGEGGRR